jgi:hypothetical protein
MIRPVNVKFGRVMWGQVAATNTALCWQSERKSGTKSHETEEKEGLHSNALSPKSSERTLQLG